MGALGAEGIDALSCVPLELSGAALELGWFCTGVLEGSNNGLPLITRNLLRIIEHDQIILPCVYGGRQTSRASPFEALLTTQLLNELKAREEDDPGESLVLLPDTISIKTGLVRKH